MLAYSQHGVKPHAVQRSNLSEKDWFADFWRTLLGAALHQFEQDAFADAAIGDAQPADRPGGADRIEDGAAAQHQIGALAPDARAGGAALDIQPGKMPRHQL